MDKSYFRHIKQFDGLLSNVNNYHIDELASCLIQSRYKVAVSVGSGGSLTSAQLFATLYESTFNAPCLVKTPLEVLTSTLNLNQLSFWIFSAEGKNPDVIKLLEYLITSNCLNIHAIINNKETPLGHILSAEPSAKLFQFPIKFKDGFLATTSVIQTGQILVKTFSLINEVLLDIDVSIHQEKQTNFKHELSSFKRLYNGQRNILVAYDPMFKSAALDLESKGHESGLVNVQITDLRNFAHGRHFGLEQNSKDSFLILICGTKTQEIVVKSITLIKPHLTFYCIEFLDYKLQTIANAIVHFMYIFALIAQKFHVDPNIVNVKDFGRSLYYLDYSIVENNKWNTELHHESIQQKIDYSCGLPIDKQIYIEAFKAFIKKIEQQRFDAVIFDYDGTLCFSEKRFERLEDDVVLHLNEMLKKGISVAIATGRGKSAQKELKSAIDQKHWPLVTVGYYNGGIIRTLNDDLKLETIMESEHLAILRQAISSKISNMKGVELESKPVQLTIFDKDTVKANFIPLLDYIRGIVFTNSLELKIHQSDHSIDIIPFDSGKLNVVDFIKCNCILTIGDSGQFGGNDFELLSHPYSLSVDKISHSLDTCWKLAPNRYIQLSATRFYFKRMILKDKYFTMKQGDWK